MQKFKIVSKFKPAGDQPQAIEKLVKNIKAGISDQVLLGVTGSGKTATLAWTIEKVQRPALVISPNKTLAAQLFQEFKDFFPNNAVHYFVSYYDYYQPEAYLPATDTYIEKDAKINQEIDRMRHSAAQDLISRKDVIVVASVSCIYNVGSPKEYKNISFEISQGQKIKRQDFLMQLTNLQYQRNDIPASNASGVANAGWDFKPGTFRVRGEIIEIYLVTGDKVIKVEFSGGNIESIKEQGESKEPSRFEGRSHSVPSELRKSVRIFPAKFWVSGESKQKIAIANIQKDLEIQLAELKKQNKVLEAHRLEQRTNYDLEMIQETGYCHGIENYSRYFEFREAGSAPSSLLEYFPDDFLVLIDESHITIPQLNAMYNTDKARKNVLIDYGFRLPSCLDNRPLKFAEFEEKAKQKIYVSATPGKYEELRIRNQESGLLVEQLVRPTGLLEPSIEIRPSQGQVKDLIGEIKKAIKKNQRVLAITLTKRMAEELADYLKNQNIKAQYLHSEIKTLERPEILNKLRRGDYDVIIGINLLREGLDLPEVGLVAILDADKEGFLRNETTLIQTMGRASRNISGRVILYADKTTGSMKSAIKEVDRRRKIQEKYNKEKNITPSAIIKSIKESRLKEKENQVEIEFAGITDIKILTQEMKLAADNLDFTRAILLRDLIKSLPR
ncbi:MAG: excinuclease ABC subunit UvrB [bacterium]|nr:excinuclease ABC subunit UvrB [bacterium]